MTLMNEPSPQLFFENANAHMQTAAIKAAIELEVFTAIGEGNKEPRSLAARCHASERGMRILCDYLAILGFLSKSGSAYELTLDSAVFLDKRSAAYLGSALGFLNHDMMLNSFRSLTDAIRKGGTAVSEFGTVAPENPVWVEFAKYMAPLMALPAEGMARILGAEAGRFSKILDVAAGHGLYGLALAKPNPGIHVVALDWPAVLEVAKENAKAAGVASRYSTIAGSAFEADLGSGYDAVLLTNFLHHFDVPTCEGFLRKVRAALKPSGVVATVEFVPDENRVTPRPSAMFSMIMLGTTPSGDAYTFSEFTRMFRNSGFSRNELHGLPPSPQQMIVSRV